MSLQTLHSKGHTLTKKDSFIANCFLKRLIENVSKIFQKAEKESKSGSFPQKAEDLATLVVTPLRFSHLLFSHTRDSLPIL